ncbi:unnamed protein product, partial [Polarella glacialis]
SSFSGCGAYGGCCGPTAAPSFAGCGGYGLPPPGGAWGGGLPVPQPWGLPGMPAAQQVPGGHPGMQGMPAGQPLQGVLPGGGCCGCAGWGGCGGCGGGCGGCAGCGGCEGCGGCGGCGGCTGCGGCGGCAGCGGCGGCGACGGCGGCCGGCGGCCGGCGGGCGGWPMQAAMNPAIMAQLQAMQAMGSCGGCCGGAEPEEPVEIRYYGQIRDYNESSGFGFIECAEAKARFGMDTFIHRRQMYSLGKNDKVSFVVIRNGNGQPQARNVIKKDETEKMLAKRADRESREAEKLQAKKQVTERIFTPAATDGKVMSEEEARQFQASLRKRK